jgi:6-pyruvoyltetrahydropterin/6-carboxytetrahydropterin synthase
MYEIRKQFHFSASHVLYELPKGHPCGRLHGHNYIVELILRSENLNSEGFVVDYGQLKQIKQWIDETFDHQHLNDKMNVNPTAENIAKLIYDRWVHYYPLHGVKVKETEKTEATYYGS